ncbi:MAG: putative glycoside hydrolase, partial [bacterium]|nr:putative glycoside hydrolase [bacterium]
MKTLGLVLVFTVAAAVFFLFLTPNVVVIDPAGIVKNSSATEGAAINLPSIPEPEMATSAPKVVLGSKGMGTDLPYQPQLQNPPEIAKGIYITGWLAGTPSRVNKLIELIKRTELNAVVIDIKDFSGYMSYRTGIPEVVASGAEGELRILQPNTLIKKLHDNGIYVIARQTVFQDPILAKAHPEWALQNASTSATWKDNKGLPWMDAAGKPVWDYNVAIAKDALARGFDEVNFDYIRFASDGDLTKIVYPFWDKKSSRAAVIKSFFKYLRENLPGAKISADLFGLSTIDTWDDLGIGQVIESAYEYFDYISPMVYPSHYAKGFSGFQNPAAYPYEIVKYSMDKARERIAATKTVVTGTIVVGTTTVEQTEKVPKFTSKLRPWLQDFDLGAT